MLKEKHIQENIEIHQTILSQLHLERIILLLILRQYHDKDTRKGHFWTLGILSHLNISKPDISKRYDGVLKLMSSCQDIDPEK